MAKPSPVLIIDGDCTFCRRWSSRLQKISNIEIRASQDRGDLLSQVSSEEFQKAVKLVDLDGKVWTGAGAIYRALAENKIGAWLSKAYQKNYFFRILSDYIYKQVARNRHRIMKKIF